MTIKITSLTALAFAAFTSVNVGAFSPSIVSTPSSSSTRLQGYIAADSSDEVVDEKAGGIGFAMDNIIYISGDVDKKGNAVARDMKHYSKISPCDISSMNADVIGKGDGIEVYEDPGLSTNKSITLAPIDAVEGMLSDLNQGTSLDGKKVLINFAGGDELMVHEVLDGVQKSVVGIESMNVKNKDVEFRSISDDQFPVDKCGVAAIAVSDSASEGNIFYIGGEWYTVSEDDVVSYDE